MNATRGGAAKTSSVGHMLILGLGFFSLWVADHIAVSFAGDHITMAGGAVMAGVYGAWLFAIGSVIQLVTGIVSDNLWTRFGRRIPFILLGAPVAAALLSFAGGSLRPSALGLYFMLGILVYFSINIFYTPYIALLPDTVVGEKQGLANGIVNIGSGAAALFVFVGLAVMVPKLSGLDNSNRIDFKRSAELAAQSASLEELRAGMTRLHRQGAAVLLEKNVKPISEKQKALEELRAAKSSAPGIFRRNETVAVWEDRDRDGAIDPGADRRLLTFTRLDDVNGRPAYDASGVAGQEIPQIYWMGALLSLIPMLYLCWKVREPKPTEKNPPFSLTGFFRDLLEEKEPVKLFLVLFCFYFPLGAIQIYAIPFAEIGLGFTEDQAPYLMALFLGIVILISLPVGLLGDRMDKKKLLAVGLFLMMVGLGLVWKFFSNLVLALVGISLFAVGNTVCMVLYYALMTLIVPPRKIGIFTGVYYFITQMSRGMSSYLAGKLIGEEFNFSNMFAMCAIACAIGFVWIHFVHVKVHDGAASPAKA